MQYLLYELGNCAFYMQQNCKKGLPFYAVVFESCHAAMSGVLLPECQRDNYRATKHAENGML